eukprot:1231076-Amphidinium_carterae.1
MYSGGGRFLGEPSRRSEGIRVNFPASHVNSVLSSKAVWTPIFDDETWLPEEQPFETGTKGGTLGNAKVENLGAHCETTSLSTDCLQEDLSNSDNDDISCLRASKWNYYLDAAKHLEEDEHDVASYTASHPTWYSRAKIHWWKAKTGRKLLLRVI